MTEKKLNGSDLEAANVRLSDYTAKSGSNSTRCRDHSGIWCSRVDLHLGTP
jgi:hypothetical protein